MPVYYDVNTRTWFCKFYFSDYTGAKKQKLKRGFALQKEAKAWERDFLERQQGSPSMSFAALADLYFEDMRCRLRPGSYLGKENIFKNHMLPYFGGRAVDSITPADVRLWQNAIIEKGYSLAYQDRLSSALSTFFNYAVRFYGLRSNPCELAGHIGRRVRSMSFYTLEEYRRLSAAVSDPVAAVALDLLFFGGFRFGELLALTFSDLDFVKNEISISKTATRSGGALVVGPPKTKNGARVVPMPAAVMAALSAYCGRVYSPEPDQAVFGFSKTFISGNMKRAAAAVGLPSVRIHDLRHSHVSMLVDLGFSAFVIADRIGDTVQMVNSTYGHLYPERKGAVASRLDSLF